jgi:hypothetical protein
MSQRGKSQTPYWPIVVSFVGLAIALFLGGLNSWWFVPGFILIIAGGVWFVRELTASRG